jgi:hypothetical protein
MAAKIAFLASCLTELCGTSEDHNFDLSHFLKQILEMSYFFYFSTTLSRRMRLIVTLYPYCLSSSFSKDRDQIFGVKHSPTHWAPKAPFRS